MAALTHRARLLVAALEAGELDFALRVARQHADDLCALLAPAPAEGSPNHLPDLEEPERVVTTAGTALDGDGRPPRFTLAIAGSYEGTTYVGVSIDAATVDDEQRLWHWLLHHPHVGEQIRELLASVEWTDELDRPAT